jgi:hypothetical protein
MHRCSHAVKLSIAEMVGGSCWYSILVNGWRAGSEQLSNPALVAGSLTVFLHSPAPIPMLLSVNHLATTVVIV